MLAAARTDRRPQPRPELGKTESHGCIRLTNWDAQALAAMIEKGADVAFLDKGNDSVTSALIASGGCEVGTANAAMTVRGTRGLLCEMG